MLGTIRWGLVSAFGKCSLKPDGLKTVFKVYMFVYLRERTAGPASCFVLAAGRFIRTTGSGVAWNIPRLCALPWDCGYLLYQRHGAGFVIAGHGSQIAFLTMWAAVN